MSDYRLERHPQFGFQRVSPKPTPAEITRFYAEEFYSGAYKHFNNSSLEAQERDASFNDGHRDDVWASMKEALGARLENASLLDVGCGYGQALAYFRRRGLRCFGFDPAQEAVTHARGQGLEVVHAGMERMRVFEGRRFDVVTLFNVLEHLAEPVEVLEELRRDVLEPGGLVVLEVPNDFSPLQEAAVELYGADRWWVAPPGHLNYFTPPTLRATLEGCGFHVHRVETTFPLELFLLMGDKYIADPALGRDCHRRRVDFELNLRKLGRADLLRNMYRALATVNVGRSIIAYGTVKEGA